MLLSQICPKVLRVLVLFFLLLDFSSDLHRQLEAAAVDESLNRSWSVLSLYLSNLVCICLAMLFFFQSIRMYNTPVGKLSFHFFKWHLSSLKSFACKAQLWSFQVLLFVQTWSFSPAFLKKIITIISILQSQPPYCLNPSNAAHSGLASFHLPTRVLCRPPVPVAAEAAKTTGKAGLILDLQRQQ